MNLRINKMHLTNFKGIKDRTIDFNSNLTEIIGKNGSGKTTLATAYHWLFANTDNDLKSNPNVYPINLEEGCPSVEIDMTIDDKPVKIRKTQDRKVTESNGTKKVALTNTYSVNEVPLSERDMQKKLSDMGFDFEKFSTLTNPNAFLSEKKDTQRKMLFAMASNYTDYQVATMLTGVDEATALLKDYSVDEVKAMQNATLKKINECYGKKGEILVARIEGLELSKVDLDFSSLELQRNCLKEQIEKNQESQRVGGQFEKDLTELSSESRVLSSRIAELTAQLEAEHKASEEKLSAHKREAQDKAFVLDNDIRKYTDEVRIYEDSFKRSETEKEGLEKKLSEARTLTMDEGKTRCPVCSRLYPESKVTIIKANFETEKKAKIEYLENQIKENASWLAIRKAELTEIKRKLEKATSDRQALETALNEQIFVPKGGTEEERKILGELNKTKSQFESKNSLIESKKSSMPNMNALKSEEMALHNELRNCEIQLSKADDNCRIDEKILELREQQKAYEQSRADAEKVLYQLDEIQKKKNELLTEEINKNFSIVKFVFFTYLKNGSYTETCIATINGKELGSSTNTGLEIKARLDIISGLQKFYNGFYPVFLDGSEALDSTSKSEITMPCQMIYLTVVDDKDLTIKEDK